MIVTVDRPRGLARGDLRLLCAWAHLGVLWQPGDGRAPLGAGAKVAEGSRLLADREQRS